MKRNGFTMVDILGLVGVLALSALIVIPKISNALSEYDNRDEVYQEVLDSYKIEAEKYGNDNIDKVKKNELSVVSIDELLKNKYILADSDEIVDIRDNSTKMNHIKFKLVFDEEKNTVKASVM